MRRNASGVAASFTLLSVWQLSEAMVPVVVGALIDHAVVSGSVGALVTWGSLLALVFASLMFAYRCGALVAYRIDQFEANRLRSEIARHVLRPRGARTGMLPGATLSLATGDADGVGTLAQSAAYTFASASAVAVSAVVLLRIDVVIGLTVLLGAPLVLFITQLVTPVISRRSVDQRSRIAATSAAAADLVRGLRVIKGIGAENEAVARYRERSQVAKVAGIRVAGSQALMKAMSTGLSGLFLAAVTLLAGERALEHSITIGQLIAIVGLTQFYAVPIQTLGQVGALVAESHASAARIVDFLRTPPLLTAGTAHPPLAVPEISLDRVTAGALHDFSLASRPGELLCLAVDDPAATRTLMQLLVGEVPAEDVTGGVRLDGVAISELSFAARHERLLVNPHQTDLLHGTLRSNLDSDGRHDDAELARILDAAAAHDIVRLYDSGLDQRVAAKGSTYSGGQRQRIALARALAADPSILVLDNPTTAVDAVTEQRIAVGIKALRHQSGSRTTWVFTTSPALLAQADRVVHVEDGRVAGVGTHRKLLSHPSYEELVLR
ncbi:ABC transporter ATP-binding protein [Micromonospora sp. WMMA1363]|uniref:ABC transporter transmembrane domain-containing protein n=1 Tax=Micromonospora sp. WMMA1363 TaxID=3053985 RepID=UPI00259C8D8F|nr:ABC transporter ATP-binding protein [Micromonospora sp. WMMA1363]MDM4719719.1 ABC transporter ATP-binding protein [Micromonospora sp. WMMA1363]